MGIDVDITKKLNGFELSVKFQTDTSILGFLGASGSGKSMTLKCISGIVTPDRGKIILNDRVLFDSEKRINVPIRDRRVGFLFQNYTLFPNMTVEENIGFGLDKSISKVQRRDIIMKKIESMQLEGMEKRVPCELSGGQQQRVALARALVVNPEILLLDEPFSSLDEYLRNYMIKRLKEDISEYTGTTILVTHNMEEAYQICKNIVIISKGRIDSGGYKEDIFNHPRTLSSAKLTGCKNISKVKIADDHTVEAIDWGCLISTKEAVVENISHVGIRAHYFELAERPLEKDSNVFECWVVFTAETLFRAMVYLKFNKPPSNQNDYHVIWDISKEEWASIKERPLPWKIWINPEKIILMRDNPEQ